MNKFKKISFLLVLQYITLPIYFAQMVSAMEHKELFSKINQTLSLASSKLLDAKPENLSSDFLSQFSITLESCKIEIQEKFAPINCFRSAQIVETTLPETINAQLVFLCQKGKVDHSLETLQKSLPQKAVLNPYFNQCLDAAKSTTLDHEYSKSE